MKRLPPPPKNCYSKIMKLLLVPSMMLWMRTFEQIRTLRELMRHGRNWKNDLRALKP